MRPAFQMNKIAIWYHTRLFGGEPTINPDWSIPLMLEQMETLKTTGLLNNCQSFIVSVNGNSENQVAARSLCDRRAKFIDNGADSKSLLRTMNEVRAWAKLNPDWFLCFFHIKGVTHPHDAFYTAWRKCMERSVIINWIRCVQDLSSGYETVGAHWLTREKYGNCVTFPFWGGQFFWARASFLSELPQLPDQPSCRQDWFLSENWIGMGRTPKVKDYAPHWPNPKPCGDNA